MIPTISTSYVPTMYWTHVLCYPPPSNKKEISFKIRHTQVGGELMKKISSGSNHQKV